MDIISKITDVFSNKTNKLNRIEFSNLKRLSIKMLATIVG